MSYFELEWATKYLGREPRVAFDVGSHNGKDAARFRDAWPSCDVYAFEASRALYTRMANNLKLDGIVLVHGAVGDRNGERWFLAPRDVGSGGKCRGAGSLLKPTERLIKKGFQCEPERVPAVRLDSFCHAYGVAGIDLIHMDLQGAEYEALRGLGSMRPALIFLEMQGGTANCYEGVKDPEPLLIKMGYDRVKKLPGDQLWQHKENDE